MTDYGHDLIFGTFVTPNNSPARQAVDQAVVAERAGLDLVTYQDHPYVARFHDTWTLLSYVAAQTERIRLSANVINLPLRPPAVLARSVASLDLLTGGRVELGLGAGAFWDGVAAMGGPRRGAGESVAALEEAIAIIRGMWDVDATGVLTVDGAHYRVRGAKRGPAPAHDVGIWLGAYRPRMLRLVGREADGWLPSLQYLPGGVTDLAALNRHIDDAAADAGREPGAIRRLLNIGGSFSGSGFLQGPPRQWAEELADVALAFGISGFVLASDDTAATERYAAEVAPAVRQLVAAER
ncbi:5,10-methylene tetrahydromethanopterin reductase [Mycolicibacterium novocastrense]|uniref:LLM class flavin-dependent oxidoreductase n=1 Tax=Mycolicibacterium novocastrense TaxID=59813 RepID=UPI00074B27FD|nr:LLM class flavin-dependent oxidoreductase [Mycolicibacterium novocastrense]KUH65495.1 5,10-methylene tetrahydromethanopterin reductase [Mycolicibacterium novocastrense]KUH77320.1 5,10-methylene tetrahydromethanopterin reductase [Mycolicibacterium novocastrense]KUH77651.1 5,10-methylene tetrahydromethanopterin reductase [Mycolicibacterium novocastrense]